MDILIPPHLQAAYEFLKKEYFPKKGDILFFDLSKKPYQPIRFKTYADYSKANLPTDFQNNKVPYIVLAHFLNDDHPGMSIYTITLIKEENLTTGEISVLRLDRKIDLDKVREQLKLLNEMLSNSKAS